MKFNNAEHVEEYFGLPKFSPDQWLLIENYIQFGNIPNPDGCMGCDAAYIRTIIGQMQAVPEPEPKEKKSAASSSVRSGGDNGDRSPKLPRSKRA